MAIEQESRVIKLTMNHTNESGKSVTTNKRFTGVDPEATESMMTNFCKGVEEVSSDTMVSRKYVDTFEMTDSE